jgi:hypothetical protein
VVTVEDLIRILRDLPMEARIYTSDYVWGYDQAYEVRELDDDVWHYGPAYVIV